MVKQKGVDLSSIPWSGAHRTRPGIKLPGAERLATAACTLEGVSGGGTAIHVRCLAGF